MKGKTMTTPAGTKHIFSYVECNEPWQGKAFKTFNIGVKESELPDLPERETFDDEDNEQIGGLPAPFGGMQTESVMTVLECDDEQTAKEVIEFLNSKKVRLERC